MMDYATVLNFYNGKRVLITGNTGFKGSWLASILSSARARVMGYALRPSTSPALYDIIELGSYPNMEQTFADIRDLPTLLNVFEAFQPEVVFHLAAQPIVRDSYKAPVDTYSTNVMGTVNVCEAVRKTASVRSFLNVTTDKVYKNREWEYGYRENDELDGLDPYSNSKSCSELVTHSYRDCFFADGRVAVSTARAGNVIGGGDFSTDRIIPDCVRALSSDGVIKVRNPHSIRPYQHVLESLFAYMAIAAKQFADSSFAGYYNVGPDDRDCVATGDLVTLFCDAWNGLNAGKRLTWSNQAEKNAPHEANFLKLDCSKLKATFGWKPRWHIQDAIRATANWTKIWLADGSAKDIQNEMREEVKQYMAF